MVTACAIWLLLIHTIMLILGMKQEKNAIATSAVMATLILSTIVLWQS